VSIFWQILLSIGACAGLSFIAALLLSLPSLFSQEALCRRRRVPLPDPNAPEPEQPELTDPCGWRLIFTRIIALPFGVLLSLVVFPAVFAMVLVATCANYCFYRHLAYRALRRHRIVFAFPLSFSVGLRVFIARFRPRHAAPDARSV
jgi:uncharacterized membrane protein YphA (DoxX/SURF4 family)